ncbi:hypothetical protein RI367_000445 [Sorochytrium milnesiophthora]
MSSNSNKNGEKYYAVAQGREPGIYRSWNECERNTSGYSGSRFKSFTTVDDAAKFIVTERQGGSSGSGSGNGQSNSSSKQSGGKYYAVAAGRQPGVYMTWDECQRQVNGYAGARFKSFLTLSQAREFIEHEQRPHRPKQPHPPRPAIPPPELEEARPPKIARARSAPAAPQPPPQAEIKLEEVVPVVPFFVVESVAPATLPVIEVYTDGCCFMHGKTRRAGVGVWFGINDKRNISAPMDVGDKHSNQRAEIKAAIMALEAIQREGKPRDVVIHTDSQYVINAMTSWIKKWRVDKVAFSNVQNRDLFSDLDVLVRQHQGSIKWNYVPGHRGILGNEQADQLAKQGARMLA